MRKHERRLGDAADRVRQGGVRGEQHVAKALEAPVGIEPVDGRNGSVIP